MDGGIVTSLEYGVYVRGRDGRLLGHEALEINAFPKDRRDRLGPRSHFVRWANITTDFGGEALTSTLTPQANAEERNRAYDFGFGCLTRLGGCTGLCQLAPSAFAD